MTADLQARLAETAPLFAEVQRTVADCLSAAGLSPLPAFEPAQARADLREDPFDHSRTLHLEWRSPGGTLLGSLLINGDGQAFAEFDVLAPHPRKRQWFVEAVTAWGYPGALRGELRLLPAIEP